MHDSFRLKRSVLRIGIALTALVSVAAIGGAVAIYFEAAPDRRIWGALVGGLIWLPFIGFGLWTIVAYFRTSITIDDTEVSITGVMTHRHFALAEVTAANWGRFGLRLSGPGGCGKVNFRDIPCCDARRLAVLFRERIPLGIQHGWTDSWEKFIMLQPKEETLAEFNAFFRVLFRKVLTTGPILGICCGLYIWGIGGSERDSLGWHLLVWAALGFIASTVVLVLLWGSKWLVQCDAPNERQSLSS